MSCRLEKHPNLHSPCDPVSYPLGLGEGPHGEDTRLGHHESVFRYCRGGAGGLGRTGTLQITSPFLLTESGGR